MKKDGRKLDLMAVQRVREGESASTVIASYGMNRTTIHKWLKQANGKGAGMRRLQARKATGRPRTLTGRQERQVFRWINGNNPLQYGLDFGLWTRQIVRDLVEREFGHRLSLASIGALLARLNLSPQKPLQRAYQRDPEAIERWQRETYPAIARRAKAQRADIYFWDEAGFRADAVQGTTWGVKGQTPVVQVPGQRQSISAASAVSAKGAFWFATYEGGLTGESFVALLDRLMHRRKKPLHLILDSLPAHKTSAVKDYVASKQGKLTLHYLPGYAPDLNPDELVWSHAKRTGVARRPLQAGEKLEERVTAQLTDIANRPS
ncbi:IS630 family transposase, partial [Noviherbaspirillum sp. Root189]|uniref:IS630 family transposase n=1 Tax=Noviherbaspirillum sp. Root189 TaxID=1736487 RepID=UPI003FA613F8